MSGREQSALGVDPSYLATALLATLAGTIGNSRVIRLKRGWTEPAVFVVRIGGRQRDPEVTSDRRRDKARPARQAKAIEVYRQEMEEYERDLDQYKADLDAWRHGGKKKGEPPPEELVKPVCQRFTCSDVTVEAAAVLLADARRGLLLIRDELAGWIGGFDQYKGGGRGADTAHWLTIYGARDILVDRKNGDRQTIFVRRAAVSIVGGIQPETLRRVLGAKHFENGLAARLLLAMPPREAKHWTEAEIDDLLDQRIGRLFDRLYEIEPNRDDNDQVEPVVLGLSAAGKAAWIDFYDRHAQRQADASGEQAAALAKAEGAAARLALIVHCVREAAGDRTASDQIDDQDVGSGVALALWYADEAERVYHVLQETDDGKLRRQVVELIGRQGGRITAAGLRQRSRHFADSDDAEQFLEELVKAGSRHVGGDRQDRRRRQAEPSIPTLRWCLRIRNLWKPARYGGFGDRDRGKQGCRLPGVQPVQRSSGRGSCIRNPTETRGKRGFGYRDSRRQYGIPGLRSSRYDRPPRQDHCGRRGRVGRRRGPPAPGSRRAVDPGRKATPGRA